MKAAGPQNRLRTPLPKVGIRPVVDGRYGGIRESLDGPAMAMAERAARLIGELKHASGQQLDCVIADTTIGGVAEAASCEAKFEREGVGLSLTVTPCWCYGSETIDMHPTRPKAIWGFNGTERPGAVYLAAALAAHTQKGVPAFGIYGRDVQELGDERIPDDVQEKLLRFARAGIAAATMRGNSYLSCGYTSMGIVGSMIEPAFWERWLGIRCEFVDMSEFRRRLDMGIFDPDEYVRALEWGDKNCNEGRDWNPPDRQRTRQEKEDTWQTSIKMALIARDLMVGNPRLAELGYPEEALGHNAIAGGFQGQRQWTDHMPNGDFMEAVLCSSFDWDGVRQPFVFATENDGLNAAAMLFGHLLTGTAQLFSDVRTYWSPEAVERVTGHRLEHGILHLINSGPSALDWTGAANLKPWWELTDDDATACLDQTLWCDSIREYFPGGGWSTDFTTRGGLACTMSRINLVAGLGPVLQIAEGATVELPEEVHRVLDERTNPTWPATWFVPRTTDSGPFRDAYSLMSAWGSNHGATCAGHVGADLIALAAMLRIPVDLHNVPEGEVWRPSAWTRFGAHNPQGADYRACAAYGPLYG